MSITMLHFADLHLGVENYGRINPQTGLSSRFEDFARTLEGVVDYALERPVDMVLFAGDAYKNRDPSPTHQRTFAAALRRLSAGGIPTVVLVGNHDVPNTRGRAHAVEVFRVLGVPNIHVADAPDYLRLETRNGPVQVLTLPYRRPSLLAEEEHVRGKSQAEIAEVIAQGYMQQLERLAASVDPEIPTVLAGHLAVGGATVGSERSMLLSDEPIVPLSTLVNPDLNLDYVALGHMHKHQDLNRKGYPAVVYSGSLERVDFGEEKEDKGFALVHLARGDTRYEFVPVAARRFVTVDCDLSGDDPAAELQNAVKRHQITDAVVRLRYTIPEEKRMLLSSADVSRALAGAFCIGRVEREITRTDARRRDPGVTSSLDAYAALQHFLEVKPPKAAPVEEMLASGKILIQELNTTAA